MGGNLCLFWSILSIDRGSTGKMLIHHGFVWPSLGEAPHALAIFYSWFSERFSIHLQGLWMFMYVYGRYIELVTCWFINQQVFHLGDTTDTSGRWLLWAPGCGSRFCWSQNWGRLENLIQQETFRAFENQQVYIYIYFYIWRICATISFRSCWLPKSLHFVSTKSHRETFSGSIFPGMAGSWQLLWGSGALNTGSLCKLVESCRKLVEDGYLEVQFQL
jgi:hypothetical protein